MNGTAAGGSLRSRIYTLAMIAVMTAVTCVMAPFAIPIGPISISLGVLAVLLGAYLLGWKHGTVSCIVYILLGMAGMPVFTGFEGGLGKALGPTGGYILGYIFMALITGLACERFRHPAAQAAGMVLGVAVLYAFGTAWFCVSLNAQVMYALSVCAFPFIPWDLAKIAVVLAVGPVLRRRLKAAGFFKD